MACAVPTSPDAFPSTMLAFLDCQATTLGAAGYQALSAPGSTVMLFVTALLTILIALFGYRMLLGETPSLRSGVLTFVRIGIVLALATSWSAYRTVVYDVTLRAPAELVANVGGPAQVPGATGGLAARLDNLDRAFRVLAIYGTGVPTRDQVERSGGVAPPVFGGFDGFAVGSARIAFLVGGLGAFALIRLGAGLLLAFGPLFLAFLLFDGTRGLFEGWLRGLIAMALGGVATALTLGIELALFEPWLSDLVMRRAAGEAIPNASAALFAAAVIFVGVLLAMLVLVARIAAALRLPRNIETLWPGSARDTAEPRQPVPASRGVNDSAEPPSRAARIADQIAAVQRREEQGLVGTRMVTIQGSRGGDGAPGLPTANAGTALGQSFRRRTRGRVSASATTRDRTA
ncbi:type IV secretion system protein [Sphingomonas panni]|uniref:type IV secretion system protein n=1 Tax=Sphingomonas panni TaxID=237612 RepID=UPI001F5B0B10|nr:type IV secretion system protein [Sphingomonas panni]